MLLFLVFNMILSCASILTARDVVHIKFYAQNHNKNWWLMFLEASISNKSCQFCFLLLAFVRLFWSKRKTVDWLRPAVQGNAQFMQRTWEHTEQQWSDVEMLALTEVSGCSIRIFRGNVFRLKIAVIRDAPGNAISTCARFCRQYNFVFN